MIPHQPSKEHDHAMPIYVMIRPKDAKQSAYLTSDGGMTRNRVRAVAYPSTETAQAECDHILKNYGEWYEEAKVHNVE